MVHEVDEEMHTEVILLLRVVDLPNICSYFDRFQLTDYHVRKKKKPRTTYCIMLDFISGQDLRCFITEQGLKGQGLIDDMVVYGFLESSLEAIAALHAEGIVHRDVTPCNLIVCSNAVSEHSGGALESSESSEEDEEDEEDEEEQDEDGEEEADETEGSEEVDEEDDKEHKLEESAESTERENTKLVLIDLGLGASIPPEGKVDEQDVGTPNYYSPGLVRVARGEADITRELWYANDIWGLGATMHFVCTGQEVARHYGLTEEAWDRAWDDVLAFTPPEVIYNGNKQLNDLILSCLQTDHTRVPSAQELLDRLHTIVLNTHEQSPVSKPPESKGPGLFSPTYFHERAKGRARREIFTPKHPPSAKVARNIRSRAQFSSSNRSRESRKSAAIREASTSRSSSRSQSPEVNSRDSQSPEFLSRELSQLTPWFPSRFRITADPQTAQNDNMRVTRSRVITNKRKAPATNANNRTTKRNKQES
jgi:serine/threonine protein kinase